MSPQHRQRADAAENRERLIRSARERFARDEAVTLEAIAQDAGVGIGTLYRHFPHREALIEAVYREQIADLRAGAASLLAGHRPVQALRRWMDLFADWAEAKRGMVSALARMNRSGALDPDASRREIEGVIATLLDAGIAAGELRAGVDPADVRSLLAGILAAAGDREQTSRLFDLALEALTAARPTAAADPPAAAAADPPGADLGG